MLDLTKQQGELLNSISPEEQARFLFGYAEKLQAEKYALVQQAKNWRRVAYFAGFLITLVNVILPSIFHTGFYR